jgi:hypothetical protein
VKDENGNEIGTATAGSDGTYTVTIPGDAVAPTSKITITSEIGGVTTSTTATLPNDVTTVTNVTGNSTDGYVVSGTADCPVYITDADGNVIATGNSVDGKFTINIPAGILGANETFYVYSEVMGVKSNIVTATTPFDASPMNLTTNSSSSTDMGGTQLQSATPYMSGSSNGSTTSSKRIGALGEVNMNHIEVIGFMFVVMSLGVFGLRKMPKVKKNRK